MSSAICDMVEGTFSKLRFDKDQIFNNPHLALNKTSNSIISHITSPSNNNNSRFYHGDINPVFKSHLDLYSTDLLDDMEPVEGVANCKLIKAQFSVLLAKSCRCSAILAGYNHTVQDLASDFAMHLSLAEHVSIVLYYKFFQGIQQGQIQEEVGGGGGSKG